MILTQIPSFRSMNKTHILLRGGVFYSRFKERDISSMLSCLDRFSTSVKAVSLTQPPPRMMSKIVMLDGGGVIDTPAKNFFTVSAKT